MRIGIGLTLLSGLGLFLSAVAATAGEPGGPLAGLGLREAQVASRELPGWQPPMNSYLPHNELSTASCYGVVNSGASSRFGSSC